MSQNNHHRKLISALKNPELWPQPCHQVEVIETHISTVMLAGQYAYKIKKPVDFGFLDFTSLADRKFYCEEEIRLNSRLAPSIYIDVTWITGSADHPAINGKGEAIEYAVRMHRFEQSALLDRVLANQQLTAKMVDSLAMLIAEFHQKIPADLDQDYGTAEKAMFPMQQNFAQLKPLIHDEKQKQQLQRLSTWTDEQYTELEPLLERRKQTGFIRECHGDMHLGNIMATDTGIEIFDGIEFNTDFRWIDTMSEIAFTTMDLTDRGAAFYARRLLNQYLEITGDYAGVAVLRFYQVYRAMVRAKVASLRLAQPGLSAADQTETLQQYQGYADLAEHFTEPAKPMIILMYGLSGSGKSTISQRLLELTGAIRLRSDRERKRLFGEAGEKTDVNAGIYSPEHSKKTYQQLLELSRILTSASYPVIVDATFLTRAQRQPFQELATQLQAGFRVLQLEAPLQVLRERLQTRANQHDNISDASVDVVLQQQTQAEPPVDAELHIVIDTEQPLDYAALIEQLYN